MKKVFLPILAVSIFSACVNEPAGEKAVTEEKKEVAEATGARYSIDSLSVITWAAAKPGATHSGTINVKEGALYAENNMITSGNFTLDINSLTNVDMKNEPEGKGQLEGHLKSPDFFDAAKFPTAVFSITGVEPADSAARLSLKEATHIIKGNLTLKDSTKNIAFPAQIMMDDAGLTAKADFNIDRTLWGMNYKGPNNPKDWFISKEVKIGFNFHATKK